MSDGKRTDNESWAVVTWAWRSLYAYTTKTHLVEGARLNFKTALMLTFRYALRNQPHASARQAMETLVHEANGSY
eukprot:5658846-Prymnesium_polylepis.1